jgi:hypothetical protein
MTTSKINTVTSEYYNNKSILGHLNATDQLWPGFGLFRTLTDHKQPMVDGGWTILRSGY